MRARLPAGCMLVLAAASPAFAQDMERACVDAVASRARVNADRVASDGLGRVGEGTRVRLTVNGRQRWDCYVNDGGQVTSLERSGSSSAGRAPRPSPRVAVANCRERATQAVRERSPSARSITISGTSTSKASDEEVRVRGRGRLTQGAGNSDRFSFSCAYNFPQQSVSDFTLDY